MDFSILGRSFNDTIERFSQAASKPGSSMGCGGAYGTRRAPDTAAASNPSSPTYTPEPPSNMICDICSVKFTLMNRKKLCGDCRNYFCSTCLPRETGKRYGDRICFRCKELNKNPPLRTELMKLRVKDLQNYLVRKRVNTKACVEKKDLVELVLRENGGEEKPKVPPPTSSSWEDPTIRVSDQVPLERKNNFPKSYVESSHRREWFEKLSEDPQVRDVEETLVEEIGGENEVEETSVEPMDIDDGEEEDEVISVAVEDKVEDLSGAAGGEETDDIHGASGSENPGVSSDTEKGDDRDNGAKSEEEEEEKKEERDQTRLEGAAYRLNVDVTNDMPSSSPSSPRKFAHHSMVYLSELESLDDLKELSSKQVKEILAMNRVNFKGCVEKEELLKIVERLWKQDQKSKEADVDELDDDSLCKICMDAPVDCVMLECGHMCTCTNCGKQMAECPICRQYVIRVVRTFKS